MAAVVDEIPNASSEYVIQAGARLGATNNAYPFLDSTHPFLTSSPAEYLDSRMDMGLSRTDVEHFADFLVLASSFHLLEGWRYLSKAAFALLTGANNAGLHLAYYAELRAARSMMASSGIHIGNKEHFLLTADGDVITLDREKPPASPTSRLAVARTWWRDGVERVAAAIGGSNPRTRGREFGTHAAAWTILKAWATQPENGNRLAECLDALQFRGIDWVEACRASQSPADVLGYWLQDWSVDLRATRRDVSARHIASYAVDLSPNAFLGVTATDFALIRDTNKACLFQDTADVDAVDLALLNDFCFKAAKLFLSPKVLHRNDGRIWSRIQTWMENSAGYSPDDSTELTRLIRTAPNGAAGTLLERAKVKNRGADAVFGRAFLLLRLATEVHRWLWKQIRIVSRRGATSWQAAILDQYALQSNLLDATKGTTDFADFESDVADAVADVETWEQQADRFSGRKAWEEVSASLLGLCRFERIALWSCDPEAHGRI